MKKSERIQTLVELKAQQEKNSLEAFGDCQRRVQEARQQHENLQSYRQEYLDKYQGNANAGIGVAALLDFRAFIEKLDQAIEGQALVVQQTELELMQKRRAWEHLHQQSQSLQKVCDGLIAEEQKIENKREQTESDDRSSRMIRGRL